MIPKKIHYCWFGRGEKPELAKKCIESWKKYLPEYEIKEWSEDNFDLDKYPYVREAYDSRKFAFVTDVVRLYALYKEGGVYMDTDVEVLKPLDSILGYKAVSGFESNNRIPTGLIASEQGVKIIADLLSEYDNLHFIRKPGNFDLTTNVTRITNYLLNYGLTLNNKFQTVQEFTLLPWDYLCPKSYEDGKIYKTDNTLTIHHFAGSWLTEIEKKALERSRKLLFIPERMRGYISYYSISLQKLGFLATLHYIAKRFKEKSQKSK